jgi:hypothetical protein
VTTRAKSGASKRKNPSKPEGGFSTVEKHPHDAMSNVRILNPANTLRTVYPNKDPLSYSVDYFSVQGMMCLKSFYEKKLRELEETLADMRGITAAKDKDVTRIVRQKKALEEDLKVAESRLQEEVLAATEHAKIWAAKSVIQARIKMAKEAGDPGFDRSAWDVAKWEQALADLGEDDDVEEPAAEKADQVGTSKGKEGEGGAGGEEAKVGDEDVMQV